MVQVCAGGVGERGGGDWREMEFYPWREAGRGLTRARLADHGKSDGGGLEVPSAVRVTRGETSWNGRPGASAVSSDCPASTPCTYCLPSAPHLHYACGPLPLSTLQFLLFHPKSSPLKEGPGKKKKKRGSRA